MPSIYARLGVGGLGRNMYRGVRLNTTSIGDGFVPVKGIPYKKQLGSPWAYTSGGAATVWIQKYNEA